MNLVHSVSYCRAVEAVKGHLVMKGARLRRAVMSVETCRGAGERQKLGSGICVTAGSGRSRGWSPLSVKDIAVRVTSSNSRQSYDSSERSRLLRRSASCASRSVGIRDRNMSPPEILPRPQKRGTGIGSA